MGTGRLALALAAAVLASVSAKYPARAGSCGFSVVSYDVRQRIDPEDRAFSSSQEIIIANSSEQEADRVCFLLHPDLVVDDIGLRDAAGREFALLGWEAAGTEAVFAGVLQAFDVRVGRAIGRGEEVTLRVEAHLRPEAVKGAPVPGEHVLQLVVSPEASYAVGPHTGHLAVVRGEIAAPFRLAIEHPEDQLCAAPGHRVRSEATAGAIIEVFESARPGIPTFSCAHYDKTVRTEGRTTLEFYLYPGSPFAEGMASFVFDVLELYTDQFGPGGDAPYRFATVAEQESRSFWWENKGNAIYFTDLATRRYAEDPFVQEMYTGLVAHELFHDWNLFQVSWSGRLAEWFGEGGANFIASWAGERLRGEDFAAGGRAFFLAQYDDLRGYEAAATLESASKAGPAEQALIYYYGALVWEQLRQKLGDEALLAGLRDLFDRHRLRPITYAQFVETLQARTDVPVERYLEQWIRHNARIDLSVGDVSVRQEGGGYETQVEVVIDADRDYELFTAVGFKTSTAGPMTLVPLHLDRRGQHTVAFESPAQPVFIQLDPAFRVPQINLSNNTWQPAH